MGGKVGHYNSRQLHLRDSLIVGGALQGDSPIGAVQTLMATLGGEVVSTISGETLDKARKELFEDPDTRLERIQELRERIEQWKPSNPEEEGIEFDRKDSSFLLRFLRARKFDLDRSLQLYVNYHKYRRKYAHLIGDNSPQAVEHILKSGIIRILEPRKKDGSKVIGYFPACWDSDNVPLVENFRAAILIIDRLIEDEETQVHGISVFGNMQNVSFFSIFKATQSEVVRKGMMMELIQEAFPARFKGMHLINQPWYVSIVLAILRPFMKQKLRDRFIVHGSDFDSLYEYIDPEQLPSEFGGPQPSMDTESAFRLFENELSSTQQ